MLKVYKILLNGEEIEIFQDEYGKFIKPDFVKELDKEGTALKPANEPIVVARKPLSEKTVALNVLKWGTGGINIDGCRIGTEERTYKGGNKLMENRPWNDNQEIKPEYNVQGRFPANIILNEEAAELLDQQSGETGAQGKASGKTRGKWGTQGKFGTCTGKNMGESCFYGDKGGASRFFYVAKASKSERNYGCEDLEEKEQPHSTNMKCENCNLPILMGTGGETCKCDVKKEIRNKAKNNHPTVKPIKLMEYLVKLVSREGAIVLDPFGGSGTTAIACVKQGRRYILMEKEEEYCNIARARLKKYTEQRKLSEINTS